MDPEIVNLVRNEPPGDTLDPVDNTLDAVDNTLDVVDNTQDVTNNSSSSMWGSFISY